MREICCLFFVVMLAAINVAPAHTKPDITGRWVGNFDIPQADGKLQHDTAYLILKADADGLTGSAGRAEDMQTPIKEGRFRSDEVDFSVEVRPGTIVRFQLKLRGDHLVGTASGLPTPASAPIRVDVTRIAAPSLASLFDKFMGVALVAHKGHILLHRAYGSANLEWLIANTTSTKFRIGSLTKQFTAASILLLAQRHQLRLDDPVSKYIEKAPNSWSSITITQLLHHTSGIVSLTDLPASEANLTLGGTPADILARFRDKPLLFPPGTQSRYSNSGYILLAMIVERVSGMSYATFLQRNILDPLDMRDTGVDDSADVLRHRAAGYRYEGTMPRHADYIDMRVPFGAGDLYSTTGDLQRWEEGLFGGRILQAEWLKAMLTPSSDGYGMGVMATMENGRRLISHTGAIQGFVADMRFYPDDQLMVIVLSNTESKDTLLLSRQLAERALTGKLEISGPPSSLRDDIIAADRRLFDAYNACHVESFSASLSPNLEFFHDSTGLTNHDWNVRALRERCAEVKKYRRELDEASVEVFPVPGYGALEIGSHRFYEHSGDGMETLVARPKFANVWQSTPAGWQLMRVLSYGH
jgi:CubicO group peptidase (beta-lactamase class C family)